MRLRSPLKPIGARTAKWQRWRTLNYELLRRRCKGQCEGCGKAERLDVHHVWRRLDEPFSSDVSLLAGLCRDCHRHVTDHSRSSLQRVLDLRALERFQARFGTASLFNAKAHWEYDSATNRIVRKQS